VRSGRKRGGVKHDPAKPPKPGVYVLEVGHDDGCPCLTGKPLPACTCKRIIYRLERAK
jgi:hypothetical protein